MGGGCCLWLVASVVQVYIAAAQTNWVSGELGRSRRIMNHSRSQPDFFGTRVGPT